MSLIFALQMYNPAPMFFFDEVDAALDEGNVCRIANYIKNQVKVAQCFVISHRREMYGQADLLVGVYKVGNVSGSEICKYR